MATQTLTFSAQNTTVYYNVKQEFRVPLETEQVLSFHLPSGNLTHIVSKLLINLFILF